MKLPLEVEIYRNNEHSVVGKDFRNSLNGEDKISKWYRKAQLMAEKTLVDISSTAENGQIDATKLSDSDKEFLQIYLENQVSKRFMPRLFPFCQPNETSNR